MKIPDMHPDQLAAMTDSEEALGRIHRQTRETFHEWLKVGKGVATWREVAMRIAQTDDIQSDIYRKTMKAIAMDRFPMLAKLSASERTHAAWLWENHEQIEIWHLNLRPEEARRYNHPTTIWRKNPLGEYREKKDRTSRLAAADIMKDAVELLYEAKDRFETASTITPGTAMDVSTPAAIEDAGHLLVHYYGPAITARMMQAAASLPGTGLLVISPDTQFEIIVKMVYDWLPDHRREEFAVIYGKILTRHDPSTLEISDAEWEESKPTPAPTPTPAPAAKKPRQRSRKKDN